MEIDEPRREGVRPGGPNRAPVKQISDYSAPSRSMTSPSAVTRETPQPTFEPIKRVSASSNTDSILPANEVKKGYEFAPDQFVTVDAEELKNIAPQNSADMEITEFVHLAAIDPLYYEASYYVRPEPAGEKPYALLHAAMLKTGLVAVARFAMHRREHIVVLRPGKKGIIAHTIYFSFEVRSDDEYTVDPELVTPKELELASALVTGLSADFDVSKFRDTYREQLEALISAKVQGKASPAEPPQRKPAAVTDITEALRASLSKLKKPVSAEQPKSRVKKRPSR